MHSTLIRMNPLSVLSLWMWSFKWLIFHNVRQLQTSFQMIHWNRQQYNQRSHSFPLAPSEYRHLESTVYIREIHTKRVLRWVVCTAWKLRFQNCLWRGHKVCPEQMMIFFLVLQFFELVEILSSFSTVKHKSHTHTDTHKNWDLQEPG